MNEQSSIVQLAELGLIILVGGAILSALGVYAMREMQSHRPRSSSYPDSSSLHFQGRGEMTVTANSLLESAYRIDYWLPPDGLVKIDLIERATGNDEVILIKSGQGVEGFAVPHAGDYLLHIAPLTDDAVWSFEIRPIGPKSAS